MFTLFKALKGSKEFSALFTFLLIQIAVSTIFYVNVEGWRTLDALYFVVMTIATVGYGDITPQTDPGKIFTIVLVVLGVGTTLSFITIIAKYLSGVHFKSVEKVSDFISRKLDDDPTT